MNVGVVKLSPLHCVLTIQGKSTKFGRDKHACLKCNLVNFDIPNGFPWYKNPYGMSKLTQLHFKGVCNIP